MRQLRLRRAASLAAVVIGTTVLAAACGNVKAGSSGSSGSSGGSAGSPAAAACATPPAPSVSGHVVTIGSSDNGKALCLKAGMGVLVYLHGTMTDRWSPIQSSSAVLAPRANGHLMLAMGVTGAYFVAVHPGSATLTSHQSPCGPTGQSPGPGGPTTSGSGHCTAIGKVYHVTLMVSR